MSRSEICTIYSELADLNENRLVQEEYLEALRSMDIEKLQMFESFGKTARHRVLNVHAYREGLKYGFSDVAIGSSGWLKRVKWLDEEEISFRVKSDNAIFNHITIGRGPNGKWTYGVSYNYWNGGGGYGLSIYSDPFASKDECIKAGVADILSIFTPLIDKEDTPSKNKKYIREVISVIEQFKETLYPKVQVQQLSLF